MSFLKSTVFVYCILALSTLPAAAQNTFYKNYGTANDDAVYYTRQCSDGGYFLLGRTHTAVFRDDAFAVRTDSAGDILWQKIIHFDSADVSFTGGGLLSDESSILIFREYNPVYQPTTTLLKLDPNGNTLWTRQLFSTDICCTNNPVIPLPNGEFLLAGRFQFFMGEQYFGYLCRIDVSGNQAASLKFGVEGEEVFVQAYTLTPDSEIAIVGWLMEHIATHPEHSFLVKADLNANFISGETYRDSINVSMQDIVANDDHTYTLLCSGKLLNTDTSGSILLSRANIGSDNPQNIYPAPDSGYYVSGIVNGTSGYYTGLAKTNASGDTLWTQIYSDAYLGAGLAVNPADGSMTFPVTTDTITNLIGGSDGGLIHVDAAGKSACYSSNPFSINFQTGVNTITGFDSVYTFWSSGYQALQASYHQITYTTGIISSTVCSLQEISEQQKEHQCILSPNPVFENYFQLTFPFEQPQPFSIQLLSLESKVIFEWNVNDALKKNQNKTFSLPSFIANGIYFLNISTANYPSQVIKLVLAK